MELMPEGIDFLNQLLFVFTLISITIQIFYLIPLDYLKRKMETFDVKGKYTTISGTVASISLVLTALFLF